MDPTFLFCRPSLPTLARKVVTVPFRQGVMDVVNSFPQNRRWGIPFLFRELPSGTASRFTRFRRVFHC